MREPVLSYGSQRSLIKVIYLMNDTIYEGWIDFKFTFMHKDVLVITQDYIGISEQSFWIRLID